MGGCSLGKLYAGLGFHGSENLAYIPWGFHVWVFLLKVLGVGLEVGGYHSYPVDPVASLELVQFYILLR